MTWRVGEICVTALALFLAAASARADSVAAEVDRTEATPDSQIILTVTVEGSQTAAPKLPALPDFEVFSQGQSRQFSFVNGAASSQVVYNYVLVPKRPGQLTIPPITVDIAGKQLATGSIAITVSGFGQVPPAKHGHDRDVYADAVVSNDGPYVSEQVVYTLRFLHRVQIANASVSWPWFAGLEARQVGKQRDYEAIVSGRRYSVAEFKFVLHATRPGKFTIEPATLSVDVATRGRGRRTSPFDVFGDPFGGDFFGSVTTEKRIVHAPAVELKIRPLPAPPPGFSGVIGEIETTAALSKAALRVGESATLTMTVKGTGKAASLPEPEIDLPASFKAYEDKPSMADEPAESGVRGKKIIAKALVPTATGRFTITPKPIVFFDSKAGQYRSARAEPLVLEVTPGEQPGQLNPAALAPATTVKTTVRVLGDDILPIYKRSEAIEPPAAADAFLAVTLPAALLPFVSFCGCVIWLRVKRDEAVTLARRRRRQALRQAMATLSRARRERGNGKSAQLSHQALRGFFGDKFGLSPEALTRNDIVSRLETLEVSSHMLQALAATIDRLERAQYSGQADFGLDSVEERRLQKSLKHINRAIERSRPEARA